MQENVFINYRRQTESGVAGRIYDNLSRALPGASIFMDVDKLNPGEDFEEGLKKSLDSCKVFLAIMGPQWATVTDQTGQRRLDNPADFVRKEVGIALTKGVRVIPVLVGNAQMPDAGDLPTELKPLAKRHALEVRHEHFNADVEALAKTIASTTPGARTSRRMIAVALTAALVIAAAGGISYLYPGAGSRSATKQTFQDPRVSNGHRLDRCLHWGTDCGDPVANAWCQTKGFAKSESHKILLNVQPTYVIGDNKVCDLPICTSFSEITCVK